MVLIVCLLAAIAFKPATPLQYRPSVTKPTFVTHSGRSNPAFKVFEVEPDANKINEILTKYGNEGAFELAVAPFLKPGPNAKVILILVQHL
jgi:hypothetical protein